MAVQTNLCRETLSVFSCDSSFIAEPTSLNPTCIDTGSLEADEFATVLDNEMSTIEFAPVDCVTAHGFVCRVLVPCESAGSFEEGDIPFDSGNNNNNNNNNSVDDNNNNNNNNSNYNDDDDENNNNNNNNYTL